ncbi:hypothetical protein [Halarsenatibacter silvermanii]|uniref:Uncharacterized protein n=1 Tax=Halarsenatibacter silvermanii TaxID=321763 RepID=A0A1G9RCN9_9FIRM|nr:hypothetical protein [Halarsenatibacter silvermanii]SDM20921.1 hypothetical protein SAMN04488692_12137 [Halarsenatibacter silvermanii]
MDYNLILSAVQHILLTDEELENLLGEVRVVKGPRRPESWDGKNCFTCHVLSNPRDADFKTHNGTFRVNHYCPNYADGNANVELMGKVTARLTEILDDVKPDITGYEVYDWAVEEPLGPLFDAQAPGEHYSSLSVSFFIKKE